MKNILFTLSGLIAYSTAFGFTAVSDTIFTEKTRIEIAGGLGNYVQVIKDENYTPITNYNYSFFDGGISVEHNFFIDNNFLFEGNPANGIIVGRFGTFKATRDIQTLRSADDPRSYALQYLSYSATYSGAGIGINTPYVGLVAGLLFFEPVQIGFLPVHNSHVQPMGKLRIGYEDVGYFSASLLYNTALLADGGQLEVGFACPFGPDIPEQDFSLFTIAFAFSEYREVEGILRGSIVIDKWKSILLSGNLGFSKDETLRAGFSAGLRITIY